MPDQATCRKCARAVPWLSLWGNFGLGVYKLAVGLIGGSASLVADAFHSFADVVGSTGILIATKISAKDPDEKHPYGYGKAEFIGATFVYTLLTLFAIGIIVSAIRHMQNSHLAPPHIVTLLGAIVSIFYNLVMYKYAMCVGRRNNSPAILADAFENRADAVSSVACVIGIAGALLVHPAADPIAAIVVGLVILKNCGEQLKEAIGGLMDSSLGASELKIARSMAMAQDGVVDLAFLRTRQTGPGYWVDLGVRTEPNVTIGRTDEIVSSLQASLMRNPKFHYVSVFVLPADAEGKPDPGDDGGDKGGAKESAKESKAEARKQAQKDTQKDTKKEIRKDTEDAGDEETDDGGLVGLPVEQPAG